MYFETGFVKNLYDVFNDGAIAMTGKRVKLYRSVKEYLDDFSSNTKHTYISLENLNTVFGFYFVILGGIFVVFATVKGLPKTKIGCKIMRMKIRFFLMEWSKRVGITEFRRLFVNWFRNCFRANIRNCNFIPCTCSCTCSLGVPDEGSS